MLYIRKFFYRIRNKLFGNELNLIRQELNEATALRSELHTLSKDLYICHENIKDQMIRSQSKKN